MSDVQNEGKKPGLGELTKRKHVLLDADGGAAWLKRRKAALAKKKARYLANRQARAAFYSEHDGEIGAARCASWHTALNAMSAGTYG